MTFDESSDSAADLEVTKVGLHRTDEERDTVVTPDVERAVQRSDFDGIASDVTGYRAST